MRFELQNKYMKEKWTYWAEGGEEEQETGKFLQKMFRILCMEMVGKKVDSDRSYNMV